MQSFVRLPALVLLLMSVAVVTAATGLPQPLAWRPCSAATAAPSALRVRSMSVSTAPAPSGQQEQEQVTVAVTLDNQGASAVHGGKLALQVSASTVQWHAAQVGVCEATACPVAAGEQRRVRVVFAAARTALQLDNVIRVVVSGETGAEEVCVEATWAAKPTSGAADSSLNFFVMGDWGGSGDSSRKYTTTGELATAAQLKAMIPDFKPAFVLAVGDNFYENGVTSVDDERFQYTFQDVFPASDFNLPFYLVAGNHDWNGNVSAQIAYSGKDQRWVFPDYYYTFTQTIPGSNATVQFVMLDTMKWIFDDPVQYAWAEKQMSTSTADWLIVVGHFPVWSIAEHGPSISLVYYLKPLLEKYKAAAYICGHEHGLENLREDGSTVDYFVSGAAHGVDYSTAHINDVPANSLKFYWPQDKGAVAGFMGVTLDSTTLTAVYYDQDGNQLFTVSKQNPRSLDSL